MALLYLLLVSMVAGLAIMLRLKFQERRIMSIVFSVLMLLLVSYSILGWSLYFMQSFFLYRPIRTVLYNPGDMGLVYDKVSLTTEDGVKISGWFIPADNAEFTVLFCHGNAGNLYHRLDTINIFNEIGMNCLIFDYRGYGSSQGKPTEDGTYLDAAAAWKWLTDCKKIDPRKIVIFGRSLGGSVAAHLAGSVQPGGLILESSFTSYPEIGKKFYPYMPVRLFAKFKYDTLAYLEQINCPVMIIHSRDDEIIPFEFGLKLYDAASGPKEFVEIFGRHNDGFLYSMDTYKHSWRQWLNFPKDYKPVTCPVLKRIS